MLKQTKFYRSTSAQASSLTWLIIVFILTSLACSLGGSGAVGAKPIRIKTLSSLTPTVAAVAQAVNPVEPVNPPLETSLEPQPAENTTLIQNSDPPTLAPTTNSNALAVVSSQSAQPAAPAPVTSGSTAATPTATAAVVSPQIRPTSTAGSPAVSNPPASSQPQPTPTQPPPPPAADPDPDSKSETPGWSFIGVKTSFAEENAIVVGELVNNTGAPQQEVDISGIFYNGLDQVIEDEIDTVSHIPVDVIPVGAHIPFELVVESSQPIYRLDLLAMSEPADDPPRQDFQFSNVNQKKDPSNMYCLGGQVKNLGSPLEDYLVVMLTTYNYQGQVVSFGEYSPVAPEAVFGDQASPFAMCVDPLDQVVAYHEVRAIGY